MKLIIVDYESGKLLSVVKNIEFIPVANILHSITTLNGCFDIDMVDIDIVTNTITVHSKDYSLEDDIVESDFE